MQGCRQEAEALPQILKLMLLCVQAVTAKGRPKLFYYRKTKDEKQLSGYKQCYTYKNQCLAKYMNSALIMCNQLDLRS